MATVNITGLDGVLNLLKSLPPEVVSKRGGPVKAALRKGAFVIARPAALNLARSVEALGTDDYETTGLLLSSLIVSRGKPPAGQNGERYLVRIKNKKYQRNGKTVTTQMTGRWLEYGTRKQPAEPWLRPAFEQNAEQAINTTRDELLKAIDKIVRKLGKR